MSLERDCLSLFESLKSIQCSQENFKHFSSGLLQVIKDGDEIVKNELKDCKQNNDISIHNLSLTFNRKSEKDVCSESYFDGCESKKFGKHVVKSVQSSHRGNIVPNKFLYLKKGQGLSRFNYKICKRLKKKESNDCFTADSKNCVEGERVATSLISNGHEDKKQNNFEKLEELVESESFCSTSSKVSELLKGSLSFSSPILSRVLFNNSSVSNQESISLGESCRSYHHHRSAFKKPFSGKENTISLLNREMQTCMEKELQACEKIENNSLLSSTSEKFTSGILKKKSIGNNIKSDSSSIPTPLSTKVKFLERGVKVLEYDYDENAPSCLDDTDLLSSSDFENLINFHVNISHENSVSNYFTDKENAFSWIDKSEKSQSISEPHSNTKPLFFKNKSEVENASSQQRFSKVGSLGEKSCKMLLLAKIDELNKEINIFKIKNKCLEESNNSFSIKKCIVKSKPKDFSHSFHEDGFFYDSSLQVQKLTKELINLKREYNLLIRKELPIEEHKTAMRKISKHKTDMNRGFEKLSTIQSHISYQSQNKNTKPILFNSTCPISSSNKGLMSVSKNSVSYTTTSLQERSTLELDSQEPDELIPLTRKENADVIPISLKEKIGNPQISCVLPLNLLLGNNEMYEEKNIVNILEDSMTKIDENIIYNNETNNNSLLMADNILSSNLHISRITNKSSKVLSPKVHLPKNKKIKQKITKEIFFTKPAITFNDLIEINDNEKIMERDLNILTYPNGDKEINYFNKNIYYYASNNSTRTVCIDEEKEEVKFANGQREIYNSDGSSEVIFPDSSSKIVYANGSEMCVYQDGTKIEINRDKTKIIHFTNGQKEIHKSDSTWRVYPNGTTKILYKDGREETRYPNGKIRFKEPNGSISINQNE